MDRKAGLFERDQGTTDQLHFHYETKGGVKGSTQRTEEWRDRKEVSNVLCEVDCVFVVVVLKNMATNL